MGTAHGEPAAEGDSVRFKLKCRICGECAWIRGTHESDTNATVLDDKDPYSADACEHLNDGNAEYDIVDEEYENDYDDG